MTNKTITIFGSGRVATMLATKLVSEGYDIIIGTRDSVIASEKWRGPAVTFKNYLDAANDSSIIINATPGKVSLEIFSKLQNELAGKILVDVSNATEASADGLPGKLLYPNSSIAEHLQEILPDTYVVKTLNTMIFTVMVNPQSLSTPPTAFLSGNNQEAKESVRKLLNSLGWSSPLIQDLGDITTACATEAFILFVPLFIRTQGFVPFALAIAK